MSVVAESLTKVYPDGTRAVDGLSLEVRTGEVFGLLGPNGAGKTTTAGILTTRVVPTTGHAEVAGIDVVARPAAARRHIGVVPQHNTLDRSLTVRENLVFHGRFFGMTTAIARRSADATLDQVALGSVAGKSVEALSGGMARRLMIARAVMHRPAVLFLDEPSTGLDLQSRLALHELVVELNAAGQTIVLITHDMEEADDLSDRLAIVDHGRLLALDTPENLRRSVDADTVATVVTDTVAADDLARLATLLAAEVPGAREAHDRHGAVMLTVAGGHSAFAGVVAVAERHGLVLRDVRVEEPTLGTVFITLTGRELRD